MPSPGVHAQPETDHVSATLPVTGQDLSPVVEGDLPHHGQAYPPTRHTTHPVGTVEAFEVPVEFVRVDAGPTVEDLHRSPADTDLDGFGSLGIEFGGVLHGVGHSAFERAGTPPHDAVVGVDEDLPARATAGACGHALGDLAKGHLAHRLVLVVPGGQADEFVDQGGEFTGLALKVVDESLPCLW